MAVRIALQGRVVGYTSFDYDFVDDSTGEKIKGTALSLWLSQSFEQEPAKVKVPADMAEEVFGVEFGQHVNCAVELFARGNAISYKLVAFDVVANV